MMEIIFAIILITIVVGIIIYSFQKDKTERRVLKSIKKEISSLENIILENRKKDQDAIISFIKENIKIKISIEEDETVINTGKPEDE